MRRMLEWRIEIDHGWSIHPGVLGRGLERLLPADTAVELANTYVGTAPDNNWAALFRTSKLFRRVAQTVGAALGYPYPQLVDERVSAYLEEIRQMPDRRATRNPGYPITGRSRATAGWRSTPPSKATPCWAGTAMLHQQIILSALGNV